MKTKEEPLTPDFPSRDTEPFRVPDGYFEGLTNRILSALPDPPADAPQPPTVSLMEKVKPLIYLAAAFLGMVLLFKGLSALRPADRTTERPLYVQHATTPSKLTFWTISRRNMPTSFSPTTSMNGNNNNDR